MQNQAICFNIAVNYSSRNETTKVCHQLTSKVQQGKLSLDKISESRIAQHPYTANTPALDLLIRTSGEMRLSNFLVWQMAYKEMYFTDVLFPDFDRVAFHQALLDNQKRDRAFGKLATSA